MTSALDASYGRLQGCSGQDMNHGHSHLVAHSLRADGFDASEDGTGRGTPLVPVFAQETADPIVCKEGATWPHEGTNFRTRNVVAFTCKDSGQDAGEISPTLRSMSEEGGNANAGGQIAVALTSKGNGEAYESDVAPSLQSTGGGQAGQGYAAIRQSSAVRRLTPRECERLQGFPDDYTMIPYGKKLKGEAKEELARFFESTYQYSKGRPDGKYEFDRERFEREWPAMAADGPRYKALGNSMAVPCMLWIGQRIQMVEAIISQEKAA